MLTLCSNFRSPTAVILPLLMLSALFAAGPVIAEACDNLRQFTFSWQFADQCGMQPRGGTSRGAGLTLAEKPHPGWLAVQATGLDKVERDRRAILAMAGPYRTSFDFLEVVGFHPDFEPDPPYQSWGTEYVYVVEDTPEFISLQHIMVMYYENDGGEVIGPVVQKHWRQDWQYQQRDLLVYAGNNRWQRKRLPRSQVRGSWSQSVYQVDDSPRYAAVGRWQHDKNVSTWLSETTWRPLPRRESSFRDDYDVLIGTNRHSITPAGWVHEQENYKTVLGDDGRPQGDTPYLSKELGFNRYERLKDFDFSAGDTYWQRTGPYWADVRRAWDQLMARADAFTVKKTVDGVPLFMPFFNHAEQVAQAGDYDREAGREAIENILQNYVVIE